MNLPTLELFINAAVDREHARQVQDALDLAAIMRTPKADISRKSGILERESPLFHGTGENPCLF